MFPILFILLVQTSPTATPAGGRVALDILRPNFHYKTSLLSVAAYAKGRFKAGTLHLEVELPFFHIDFQGDPARSTIGNPYVGMTFRRSQRLSGTVGVRLPLATRDRDPERVGSLVDLNRYEAFRPNTASIQTSLRVHLQDSSGLFLDAAAGPTIWLQTANSPNSKSELVMHHQVTVGLRDSDLWIAAGFRGLSIFTESAENIGELTLNELELSLGASRGRVRPTFQVLVPLDEENSAVIPAVLAVSVAVSVGR